MVVVALLSVDLVESVDLVSVKLVVNCICLKPFGHNYSMVQFSATENRPEFIRVS